MADDLRVAIIGQAAFGKDVLNALVENDENIVGVFCPPDREGRPVDPIKEAAQKHDIPVFQFRRMRNQDRDRWRTTSRSRPNSLKVRSPSTPGRS